jgi:ribose transport system substrate-binding protein
MQDGMDTTSEALTSRPLSRRGFLSAGALLGAGAIASPLLAACSSPSDGGTSSTGGSASGAAQGLGTPTTEFPSKKWDPKASTAGAKPDLPKRMAWQNIVTGVTALDTVDKWMREAAKAEKYDYLSQNANGNSAATSTQIQQATARGIMGLVAPGQDLQAQILAMQPNMKKGGAMFLFNSGSVTCGMAAVQYQFGKRIGTFTGKYINDTLGGEAKVAFINLNFQTDLKPREQGYIDGITEAGLEASIVTSVPAKEGTQKAGFDITNTLLQKSGDFNVVAAAGDDLALGAMAALKGAGKWKSIPDLMVCGIDGNVQAIAAIKAGNTPYKATSAAHYPMVGYVPGRLIGRWGEGLSIPQFLEYQSFSIDSPDAANKWEADQDTCPDLYEQFLDGDTTYVAGRGEISYETREGIYDGPLLEQLPDLQG